MLSILLLLSLIVLDLIYGYVRINNNIRIIPSSPLLRAKISASTTASTISVVNRISKILPNNTKHSNSNSDSNVLKFKFEKKIKYLTRVSRVDSQEKWIKEIETIRDRLSNNTNNVINDDNNNDQDSSKIIELSKELLYSGIPEQCIELYAAYYDMILNTKTNKNSNSSNSNGTNTSNTDTISFPVIQNPNLILITTRAFIAMDDLKNALKLLQATSRYGVEFDSNSKSLLLNELAKNTSPQGLRAALQLRKSMISRSETISSIGVLGLLEGISSLLLDQSNYDNNYDKNNLYNGQNVLLISANQHIGSDDEWGTTIKISAQSAYNLAIDIVNDYLKLKKKDEKSMNRKIMEEFLRIAFRTGASLSKVELDNNYEINIYDERNKKASNGIILTLETMANYNITTWNLNLANMFIDECLRIGDVEGIELVVEQMVSKNLYAHTSTFNKLLQRYADNGDSEAAYECITKIMSNNNDNSTRPDSDTIDLLLQSCIKTKKGRFLAEQFLTKFTKNYELELLSKASFNSLVQLKIMNNESYGGIMEKMIASGKQPDDIFIINALKAFSVSGNIAGALHLYKMQVKAEVRRREYRYQRAISPILFSDNYDQKFSSSLPPPSKRTVNVLLEILRDSKMYEKAIEILDDMCKRATYADAFKSVSVPNEVKKTMSELDVQPMSIALTPSAELVLAMQYEPDTTTFALVIEACIEAEKGELAMEVYHLMETWGLQPDRRVYAALILAFGLLNDIPSALGVYQEMLSRFTPDVANLQSILDVCLNNNPYDLRSLSLVIEKMVDNGLDLEIYSKDILFQGFPDAIELGSALESMIKQQVPVGFEKSVTSLATISVLVQAVRKGSSLDDLKDAINLIGSLGIIPDEETMEYFRIPHDTSYHTVNELIPKRKKIRSLLDIDMPEGYAADLSLPSKKKKADKEPFFPFQQDRYAKHSRALQKLSKGESREDLLKDNDDDDNQYYEQRDKSQFLDNNNNNKDDDDDELEGDEIVIKKKTIVKKIFQPGSISIKRTDKRSSNQREILKRLSDAYNSNSNKNHNKNR